jgi:hypothetical protein
MLRPSCAERIIAQDGGYAGFSSCGSCAPSGTDSAGFLSVQRRQGQFYPIRAGTAATLVKKILKALGFDVTKFKAQILRSASTCIVAGVDAGEHVDNVLQAASVSKKVFSIVEDLPLHGTPANLVDSSVAESVAAVTAIVSTSNVRDGSGLVLHGQPPANQGDASGVFAPLRLANRPALG